jgi:hypothetical protein
MLTALSKGKSFKYLSICFLLFTLNAKSQGTDYPNHINKWLRACLNLEAHPNFFQSKIWGKWQTMSANGVKLNRDSALRIQEYYEQIKITATGIFIFYHNKHYIVTARHFLVDENSMIKNEVHFRIFLIDNGSTNLFLKNTNYDTMPDVHYLDGFASGKDINDVKYQLSDTVADIAVISLDDIPGTGKQFIGALYTRGYRPISISDIDTSNLHTRDKIQAVGFPDELSRLPNQTKRYDLSVYYWQSPWVTIPVVSTGYIRYSRLANNVPLFTGNIFIYHGFSGGPVLRNNKLIGLSVAYGGIRENSGDSLLNYYSDEYSLFSNAKNILAILRKIEKRFKPIQKPYPIDWDYRKHFSGIIRGGKITVMPK